MATMDGVWEPSRTQAWSDHQLDLQRRAGHGVWLFRLTSTLDPIGRGALRHLVVDEVGEFEVGYVIFAEFWNQGFATEIATRSRSLRSTDSGAPT